MCGGLATYLAECGWRESQLESNEFRWKTLRSVFLEAYFGQRHILLPDENVKHVERLLAGL